MRLVQGFAQLVPGRVAAVKGHGFKAIMGCLIAEKSRRKEIGIAFAGTSDLGPTVSRFVGRVEAVLARFAGGQPIESAAT